MRLTTTAFEHDGDIPSRHTCDGADTSPALLIDDLPPGTVSLALVLDDPDAPAGTWDHWLAYDIEPVSAIPEGVASLGTPGTNSWGRTGYGGPCPPSGRHRYVFTLYALDAWSGAGSRRGQGHASRGAGGPRPGQSRAHGALPPGLTRSWRPGRRRAHVAGARGP